MSNPRFSFIVPIYNTGIYLRKCIDSILKQSFDSFEVILINDGSTDDSEQICSQYLYDNRVKYFYKVNGGLSDARNYGINVSKGEYLIFIDSDDYYYSDFLFSLNNTLNNNVDVCLLGSEKVFDSTLWESHMIKTDVPQDIFSRPDFKACAWDKVIRSEFVKNHKLFFPKGYLSEDILWCGQVLFYSPKIEMLGYSVYAYRQRTGSITKKISKKHINDIFNMIDILTKKYQSSVVETYLSFEVAALLSSISSLSKRDRKEFKNKYKNISYYLRFSKSRRVKVIFLCYSLLGYDLTCYLLDCRNKMLKRKVK